MITTKDYKHAYDKIMSICLGRYSGLGKVAARQVSNLIAAGITLDDVVSDIVSEYFISTTGVESEKNETTKMIYHTVHLTTKMYRALKSPKKIKLTYDNDDNNTYYDVWQSQTNNPEVLVIIKDKMEKTDPLTQLYYQVYAGIMTIREAADEAKVPKSTFARKYNIFKNKQEDD